jgi:hypothetical protein
MALPSSRRSSAAARSATPSSKGILEVDGDYLTLPLSKRKDRPGAAVRPRARWSRSTVVTVLGQVFNDPIER